MTGARRILAPDQVSPSMRWPRSIDPQATCRRTILLDSKTYSCQRETYGPEHSHEGIHDAYAVHGDGGAVRW